MDVPASPRPNAANPQSSSSSPTSTAARPVPAVPFASLLAAARGKLGSAMLGRTGAPARTAARPAALRGAAHGEHERGFIESALHGAHGKKRRDDEARDGDADFDAGADVDDADGVPTAGHRARKPERSEIDWLDPSARHAALLAPPGLTPGSIEAVNAHASEPLRARSLEELLPALVKRIAWAGDRNKGTVRLELGAGAYAGTTVTVHAEGGRVRVELGGNEGPELDRLRARLDTRLRGHGLDVESVT